MSFEDAKAIGWKNKSLRHVVLFDLDGTLTEPRESMTKDMIPVLSKLSQEADIGIVSGSDYEYIYEQAKTLIDQSNVRYNLHLLPCNGTKYYKPPINSSDRHQLVFETNMRDQIGRAAFQELMSFLIGRQSRIRYSGIPLTGHFIDYRGSMINWCPIGRNAKTDQREFFMNYDLHYEVRQQEMQVINKFIEDNDYSELLTVKLGGSTSFDIFPRGWNKTFCLKHFEGSQFWFVGDRCTPSGNDYELYKHLRGAGTSFETIGPSETKRIITENIIPGILARR